MRSQTFLSNAFITASISRCTNKRRALGLRNKHFKAQRRQSATFVKVRKCFGSYLLRKIAFAALSSCAGVRRSGGVLWEEESGGHLFHSAAHRQPAHLEKLSIERRAPRGGRAAKEHNSDRVGWRFGTRVNRRQNLVRLGRSLLAPCISAPKEAFYEWLEKVFRIIWT